MRNESTGEFSSLHTFYCRLVQKMILYILFRIRHLLCKHQETIHDKVNAKGEHWTHFIYALRFSLTNLLLTKSKCIWYLTFNFYLPKPNRSSVWQFINKINRCKFFTLHPNWFYLAVCFCCSFHLMVNHENPIYLNNFMHRWPFHFEWFLFMYNEMETKKFN